MTRKNNKRDGEYGQGLFLDQDLLQVMVEKMVKQVMEEQVREYLGVGYYQRGEQRRDQRNGYKPRTLKTRVGKLEFLVPQVRQGGWHPSVFERYQRSEKALICAMQEMVINGVSTRKVSKVLEEMCGFTVSAGTVSKAMQELDAEIDAFNNRPLSGKSYPYLIVDARYENIRKEGMIIKSALLVVLGISESGQREVLGFSIGDSESEVSWGGLFSSLKIRGLSGVQVVVSDAHMGIRKAIDRYFQGASWQRCRVHFMRELANRVNHRERNEVYKDVRSVFKNDDKHVCILVAEGVARKWSKRKPQVSKNLLEGVEDCLTTKSLPSSHEHCISSTNMLERLMRECKRRSRVVSIFPNEKSCLRYMGALLIETHEEWAVEIIQRKYLTFPEEYEHEKLSGVRQIS